MKESEILASIREMAGARSEKAEVSIGDDAALYNLGTEGSLLTIDSFYEGVHFSLDYCSYKDVGWKAVSAAISDIAAMGGEPECAMLSIGFPLSPSEEELRSLIGGVLESLDSSHCELVGGDVCRSPSGLLLTVAVTGTPPESGPVLRSGAKSGDLIGVTGTLGDSAAGLYVLQAGKTSPYVDYAGLKSAHLRPQPRITAGGVLSEAGVSAMEDLSDGLFFDAGHICEMSGLGCLIDSSALPMSEELKSLADVSGADPYQWALFGGEDYELVFTASPELFEKAARLLASNGVGASRVGEMKPDGFGVRVLDEHGDIFEAHGGFEHFME